MNMTIGILHALLGLFYSQILSPVIAGHQVVSGSTEFVTSSTLSSARNDLDGCFGMLITVGGASITVTDLGRWVISGNSQTHTVVIQAGDHTVPVGGTVLASTTVNTSGATPGGFKYASITPTVLTAGSDYVIGSQEASGLDMWYNNSPGSITTTAVATVQYAMYGLAPCSVALSNGNPAASFVPVGFKYHL